MIVDYGRWTATRQGTASATFVRKGFPMPITTIDRIIALLASLSPEQVADLPPAERRRLADVCRRAATLAEPRADTPPAGVLAQQYAEAGMTMAREGSAAAERICPTCGKAP